MLCPTYALRGLQLYKSTSKCALGTTNLPHALSYQSHFVQKYMNMSALPCQPAMIDLGGTLTKSDKTLPLNASTNGGDASRVGHFSAASSRVGKRCSYYLVEVRISLLSLFRRGTRRPLVLAFFTARFRQLKMPQKQSRF